MLTGRMGGGLQRPRRPPRPGMDSRGDLVVVAMKIAAPAHLMKQTALNVCRNKKGPDRALLLTEISFLLRTQPLSAAGTSNPGSIRQHRQPTMATMVGKQPS